MASDESTGAKAAPRGKMIEVATLKESGEAALVSYERDGHEERCTIPVDAIKDGMVAKSALDAGVQYGVDWARLMPTPEDYKRLLRDMGIWTLEDLRKFPNVAANGMGNIAPTVGKMIRALEAEEVN